ncbi:MurT ligase domain-containing protein [Paenibacillus filicis]|uniref:Lipid II isoglutaminyl synthase (glutamine-hydrolyzing) subunit MurT n=1 Tax=Paenibacillus gyeongsangnamensis TaxID=3388067 RepID=A0ABT4QIK3_9BACL|nr:Mur ligase family protein [Paenibacillus filicis]MCZ8516709.1 MurT ligase domain-containing protein [Paenibacillus filicis]
MLPLAIGLGKMAGHMSRMLGKQGTSLPGHLALRLCPHLLSALSGKIKDTVLVTGTNGKTTTSSILASIFIQAGRTVIHNREGANLMSGITTCLMQQTNAFGALNQESMAILEVDEGSLYNVLQHIRPQAILITNFFRDQLDRYGEIDRLVEQVAEAIEPMDTTLFINGDDPLAVRLSRLRKPSVFYGLKNGAYSFPRQGMRESRFCPVCGNPLTYEWEHYGQLGHFQCDCGFSRPPVDYEVEKIENEDALRIVLHGKPFDTPLQGAYNAYNVAAAVACAKQFGLDDAMISGGISSYRSDNGRMQRFSIGGIPYKLNLAKNPQGVNSTLAAYLQTKEPKQFILVLDDRDADGHDVSWIWDADYELLQRSDIERIYCAGRRAHDMALRLYYTGIARDRIHVTPSAASALQDSCIWKRPTYVVSNYSSLHFVQRRLEELECSRS